MAIMVTDIENVYGTTNVAQWSSFTGGTAPSLNTDRTTVAIAYAEALVETRLANSPYATPISPDDLPEIVDAKATLAGWWLWKTRKLNQNKETIKAMEDDRCRVMDLLREIKVGNYPLAAVYNTTRRQTPFVV